MLLWPLTAASCSGVKPSGDHSQSSPALSLGHIHSGPGGQQHLNDLRVALLPHGTCTVQH